MLRCRSRWLAILFALTSLSAARAVAAAGADAQSSPGQSIVDFNRLHWAPLRGQGVPAGAEIAVLRGSLSGGPVEALVKLPAHYVFPNHSHTSDETYVWIKGPFTYVNQEGRSAKLSGQTFIALPGNTPHALICGSRPCVFYVRYSRSFDLKVYPMPKLK